MPVFDTDTPWTWSDIISDTLDMPGPNVEVWVEIVAGSLEDEIEVVRGGVMERKRREALCMMREVAATMVSEERSLAKRR